MRIGQLEIKWRKKQDPTRGRVFLAITHPYKGIWNVAYKLPNGKVRRFTTTSRKNALAYKKEYLKEEK